MDNFADFKLELKEIRSSMIVLQHAGQNNNPVSNKDIENHLEVIIDKTTYIINKAENFSNKL